MCSGCFGQNLILNNGVNPMGINTERVIDCDLTLDYVRELGLALEKAFLTTKDKAIIPFIQEVRQYVEQFNTIDICSKLGRINVLRREYL